MNSSKSPLTRRIAVAQRTVQEHGEHCEGFGPQTPNNIASAGRQNGVTLETALASAEMNLFNMNTRTAAEHQGPGLNLPTPLPDERGFVCNDTASPSHEELAPIDNASGGAEPGKTIEAHWVYRSCDAMQGEGLGSYLLEGY